MLEFLEDAAVELELAVTWYDTQRPGLGAEFLDALRATVQYAEDTPGIDSAARRASRSVAHQTACETPLKTVRGS
jgi:hypothetical protein